LDVRENFTGDLSLDKEDSVKFRKSFGPDYGSQTLDSAWIRLDGAQGMCCVSAVIILSVLPHLLESPRFFPKISRT